MQAIKAAKPKPQRIARVDMGVKGLIQRRPKTVLRLAGIPESHQIVAVEDSSINTPELRGDHVFIVDPKPAPPATVPSLHTWSKEAYGLYIETQLTPDRRILSLWMLKCAALSRQLKMPVVLLVIYLKQGRYKTFPDHYIVTKGGLTTEFHFSTIQLWEHADAIRSGELWELAPLLALLDAEPREDTLREELRLIRDSRATPREKADLMGIAAQIAAKSFPRSVVDGVFAKEMEMAKTRVRTFIDDWVDEGIAKGIAEALDKAKAFAQAQGMAEGKAKGMAEGKAEGKAEVRGEEARHMTLRVLRKRFGRLPTPIVRRIEAADLAACEALIDRAIEAESLEDLGL